MTQLVDNLTIVPLPPDFQAGGFSCEQDDVDGYLAENALADELAGVTRTYLVKDGDEVVAYVSVLSDAIRLDREERPTDHPGAPAIKIGLMGVRKDYKGRKYQGRTIGCWLIDWVVGLARTLAKQVGVRYVTLDSLNDPIPSSAARRCSVPSGSCISLMRFSSKGTADLSCFS